MHDSPMNILLVEDNPGDRGLIRRMLMGEPSSNIRLVEVDRISKAHALLNHTPVGTKRAPLSKKPFDIILLDLGLPDGSGLQTFRSIFTQASDIPIIVLTGLDDQRVGLEAVRLGAQDFLEKNKVDEYLLMKSLRFAMERNRLLQVLEQKTRDLKASQDSFHGIVEKSTDGIVVIALSRLVCFMNRAALQQFKLELPDVMGHPFGLPMVCGEVAEIDIYRSDGSLGVGEMRSVETLWKEKPVYLALIRDITDRKRSEEQLIRHEKLVALGKLSSILGHEIRSPLGVIKNALEFIRLRCIRDPDEKVQKHLRIMGEEVDNVNKTIEDILGFARTKSLDLKTAHPGALIRETLKTAAIPDQIEIQATTEKDLPPVTVDAPQIRRAFLNIIANAVDAMPRGGTLTLETRFCQNQPHDKDFVAFSFTDTGEGIERGHLEQIFEPLFTTKSKGTGLGLAACRNTISAHGGHMQVESRIDAGTTLTVLLPAKEGGPEDG